MAGELLGFIGIGRMGGPMASRLLEAGYSLCVYDRQQDATAELLVGTVHYGSLRSCGGASRNWGA